MEEYLAIPFQYILFITIFVNNFVCIIPTFSMKSNNKFMAFFFLMKRVVLIHGIFDIVDHVPFVC